MQHAGRELERPRDVGATPRRGEVEDVAHDAQDVGAPLARGHVVLDLVGEEHERHLVVVADRREGEHRGDFGRDLPLGLRRRAEVTRGAQVDDQHDRQFALLAELLHERTPGARGHVPVDRADLVAGHVLAHLLEVDAAALEDRVVLPGEGLLGEPLGADLDVPDLLEDLARIGRDARGLAGGGARAGRHQGTGTASKIRATTSSLRRFSASAS